MTNPIEEIKRQAELAETILNVSDLSCYSLTVVDAFKSLIAANELLQQQQWQPIESAPRDGTKILIWVEDDENYIVSWCEWKEYGQDWDWYDDNCISHKPTHFMPLPKPPVTNKAGG